MGAFLRQSSRFEIGVSFEPAALLFGQPSRQGLETLGEDPVGNLVAAEDLVLLTSSFLATPRP
jgi:hypothetical protein